MCLAIRKLIYLSYMENEGYMNKILVNKIKCNKCGDIIESV